MATEVIMPKVDMVMDEGTFVEWLKREGDPVRKGEPLFVIQTNKANIEIEAPAEGVLAGVRAQPGNVIPVTQVIAYVLAPGETLPAEAAALPAAQAVAHAGATAPARSAAEAAQPGPGAGKVRATPVARRLAAEMGIDLAQVGVLAPGGRVHKADVLAFAGGRGTMAPARPAVVAPLPQARRRETIPLAGPRKIIAERMAYSAFTAPHITLSLWVDMSEATRLRSRVQDSIQQKTGHRVSFTGIVARTLAAVLPHHPYLNASLQGEEIVLWDDVHLGIATSLEDYLIVPVIREAQSKSLEQIVVTLGDLLERARHKRLTPAEMSGSTFTISNLGMFGIDSFTAIVNAPETAILAVGRIADTPVGIDGEMALRPMMNLTLSADHRVVDGAAAARFLAELKTALENPYLLF